MVGLKATKPELQLRKDTCHDGAIDALETIHMTQQGRVVPALLRRVRVAPALALRRIGGVLQLRAQLEPAVVVLPGQNLDVAVRRGEGDLGYAAAWAGSGRHFQER